MSETRHMRPMGDRILVKQVPWQEKTPGGIHIPQDHRLGYEDRGTVLGLGPKVTADVKVGDVVIFKRQPASAVMPDWREGDTYGEKDLLLLKEENVLAVVEG